MVDPQALEPHHAPQNIDRNAPRLGPRVDALSDCDQVRAVYEVTLTLDGGKLTETWKRENPLE